MRLGDGQPPSLLSRLYAVGGVRAVASCPPGGKPGKCELLWFDMCLGHAIQVTKPRHVGPQRIGAEAKENIFVEKLCASPARVRQLPPSMSPWTIAANTPTIKQEIPTPARSAQRDLRPDTIAEPKTRGNAASDRPKAPPTRLAKQGLRPDPTAYSGAERREVPRPGPPEGALHEPLTRDKTRVVMFRKVKKMPRARCT